MKKGIIFLLFAAQLCYAFTRIVPPHKIINKPSTKDHEVRPFAMIELYTSEGCSNCPPAYQVAEQLVKAGEQNHKQVYLLDFHVDYFNEPWVDPYSSAQNTERQRSYVSRFPDAGLYTPQMIVNGNAPILGSDVAITDSAVTSVLKIQPSAKIMIGDATASKDGSVNVRFETQNIPADSMINIVLVQKTVVQKILAGENVGKTLTHHNVVRSMVTVPAKNGLASIPIPLKLKIHNSDFSVIAFRQDLNTMKIVAAGEKDVEVQQVVKSDDF